MIVHVLKSPSTGRPVPTIEVYLFYTASRAVVGYTLYARCALSVCRTNVTGSIEYQQNGCPTNARQPITMKRPKALHIIALIVPDNIINKCPTGRTLKKGMI